jgi:hypothetical protein
MNRKRIDFSDSRYPKNSLNVLIEDNLRINRFFKFLYIECVLKYSLFLCNVREIF